MRTLCLLLAFPVFGCATVLSSSTETVDVYSDPPGATVIINGMPAGRTPLEVDLDNHESHQILVEKAGYQPASCRLQTSIGLGWVVIDFIVGVVPLFIDAITGQWITLDDDECDVRLRAEQAHHSPKKRPIRTQASSPPTTPSSGR